MDSGHNRSIRYAIVGTGLMGIEHIENIAHLDDASVVAVCDPDPSSLNAGAIAAAEASGTTPVTFTDHRELLRWGGCDALVIASPNHTHADIVMDALEHPVHLLIEKPLCTNVEDCYAVIAAAAGGPGGRVVQVGLEYRFMPPTTALLAEVDSGSLGEVRMIAIREHRFPFLTKVGNWNRFNRFTGGTFVEKCCHFFDLMNLIMGETPIRVMASGGHDVNHLDEHYDDGRPDVFDNGFVIVDYPRGRRALLDLCMFAEGSKNQQEISVVGDLGKAEALISEGVLRVGRRSDWTVEERPITTEGIAYEGLHHGSSYLEHVAFVQSIRDQRPPVVGLEEGLMAVAVGVAAHRSVETGGPVMLEEVL